MKRVKDSAQLIGRTAQLTYLRPLPMLRTVSNSLLQLISARLEELLCAEPKPFAEIKRSMLPERPGVYVITARQNELEQVYYVGRTKNLRNRVYRQHLMGPSANARLKKYLIACGECTGLQEAKAFIREVCSVRWIEQEGFRERSAIEGYATAMLFPKHGINEEY